MTKDPGNDVLPTVHHRRPLDLNLARVPRGQVFVIVERCKGCGYCIEFCPQRVLDISQDINAKGYHYPVVPKDLKDGCTHCGFCNLVCPDMAIYTEEIEEKGVENLGRYEPDTPED